MSHIRYNQDGSYVDIPHGSNYYIYDNGRDISGWSEPEFAAIIGGVIDQIAWDEKRDTDSTKSADYIKQKFAEHFGGWEEDSSGGITPPERAEIFCQCVDERIEGLELTHTLLYLVRDWVQNYDALRECHYCNTELRPTIYNSDTHYVCNKDKCKKKQEAYNYGLTLEQVETARSFEDFDDEWEYIVEHSDRELE